MEDWIEQGYQKRIFVKDINSKILDTEVVLFGWAFRFRDQGGVVFIDLRDRFGVVQVVARKEILGEAFYLAEKVRSEYVLAVQGKLSKRSQDSINPKMATGEYEVVLNHLSILNVSKTPPFALDEYDPTGEEVRLKYRYLDLRRDELKDRIVLRHKLAFALREYLDQRNFLEIETPVLNRSTPEGARDFLVPSRLNAGQFYALPQSPQIFKQILMVGGLERYFQIVKCFRDEDLRADRQPEFTQLDMEFAFANEELIRKEVEGLWSYAITKVFGISIPGSFPTMPYVEAIEEYGSDKPDIRFGMKLIDVGSLVQGSDFQVFQGALDLGGVVKAIVVPGGSALSRKEIEDLTQWLVRDFRAKGLAYMKHGSEGLESAITKRFSQETLVKLSITLQSKEGDMVFFGADSRRIVNTSLGALRLKLSPRFDPPRVEHSFHWVVDFPMFEKDENSKKWTFLHHPFTSPKDEDLSLLEKWKRGEDVPLDKIRAKAYDLVLNGTEIGGGSVRIHSSEVQSLVFDAIGIGEIEARDKFGFLLDALSYGAPPHGGIAFGLDRILMILTKGQSIRDVIAFPKTQKGQCLMSEAPGLVEPEQLEELKLRTISV